jgi:hypothetical protein
MRELRRRLLVEVCEGEEDEGEEDEGEETR